MALRIACRREPDVQSVSVPTWTGVWCGAVVPSPSWPEELSPHAHSVPSDLTASVYVPPAATAAQSVSVPTCTGDSRVVVVPSPTCPLAFAPHAHSVPFDLTATEWPMPLKPTVPCADSLAAADAQSVSAPICSGAERLVVVPSPNSPLPFAPHAQSVPSDLTATVWPLPVDIDAKPVPTSSGASRRSADPSPTAPAKLLPQDSADADASLAFTQVVMAPR